jgi:deoxyribose-phosphate aldolase
MKKTVETATLTAAELASRIDHTFLHPAGAPDAVKKLCREARKYRFACAMVNPAEVKSAVRLLKGSGVRVGTVVGFPLGANTPEIKNYEAVLAVDDGALDIDFVIDVRKLKAAAADPAVRKDLAVELKMHNAVCKDAGFGVVTKLIIECCWLTDAEKRLACRLAKKAGFDFVKTSTGFGAGGATVADVRLMRKAVGPDMGVKAAGGIRTLADAQALLAAGADRLGCSAGVAILKELA